MTNSKGTKKILLTGALGYLGSRLTDYLQDKEYSCTVIDSGFFSEGKFYEPNAVPTIDKDVRELTQSDLEGYHVLVQLAGISNDPFGQLAADRIYDPTRHYARQLAEWCKELGIRYIFPSSCSIYGAGNGLLSEASPANPQTPYSLNKLQVEEDLADLADASFSPIALRLATVFGASPRIRFDVVINMLCGMAIVEKQVVLNSDGQAWRPHLHIDDVCEAFACAIEWDYHAGELMVLNVGREDNNWKIIDVARHIQQCVPGSELHFLTAQADADKEDLVRDRKIQDGVDKRTYQVSFDKIRETLPGFECRWTVEAGIERLLEELQHHRLDEGGFKRREFYRLQQIEHLYTSGRLNDELIRV